jgi:phosphoribosyl 1,2-cyclic phosphodiesterase
VKVTFWGVRGSIACPGSTYARYGGNTSCVEVVAGGQSLIFDAGTGIRMLGKSLQKRGAKTATLFFSHTHWDHICGFPFFAPAYDPSFKLEVHGGHLQDNGGIRAALAGQMIAPNFPVPIDIMRSALSFHDFSAGSSRKLGPDVTLHTTKLNHPNGATGYRVESGGASVCYITDTEHVPGKPDANILALIAGADLVIYDCTYSDEEFPSKVGWGHSTWQEGVRLCKQAGAKKLMIFHHDPDHNDTVMDQVAKHAKKMWAGATVAKEGTSMDVRAGKAAAKTTASKSGLQVKKAGKKAAKKVTKN